uniref:Uncharacterized protein n=1 Tax=Sphaerodactylus townsendi TaxID=933632 RepID=A0ACB8FKD4_9SAUR
MYMGWAWCIAVCKKGHLEKSEEQAQVYTTVAMDFGNLVGSGRRDGQLKNGEIRKVKRKSGTFGTEAEETRSLSRGAFMAAVEHRGIRATPWHKTGLFSVYIV